MEQGLLLIGCVVAQILGTLSETCIGCDPDIPSTSIPDQWYDKNLKPSKFCNPGQFLNNKNECIDCLYGTYMTAAMAKKGSYIFCPPCLKPQSEIEVIKEPCTSTRDTEILCVDGFYRAKNCNCGAECLRCSICGVGSKAFLNHEKRKCGQFNDTICCPNENDVLVGNQCIPVLTTTTSTTTTTKTTTVAYPESTDMAEEAALKEISKDKGNSAHRGQIFNKVLVVLELITITMFILSSSHL